MPKLSADEPSRPWKRDICGIRLARFHLYLAGTSERSVACATAKGSATTTTRRRMSPKTERRFMGA